MEKYIIAHDVGTSSDKAVLVNFNGKIIETYTTSYETFYPYPAWAEQNPNDYWNAVVLSTNGLIKKTKIEPRQVEGIIFTTQSMGIIPIDKNGKHLYNNISWADGRAEKQAKAIMKKLGGKKLFTKIAGTPIIGKDVIAKIIWLKEEKPEIYKNTKYFLDVNGYLRYKCNGNILTELSGASSYGLDKKKNKWLSVLKLVGIDLNKLPPLCKSTDNTGGLTEKSAKLLGLPVGTPVFGGCDDVQSACIGSGMNSENDIHIYLGTSAWVCAASKIDKFINGAVSIKSADPNLNLIVGITEGAGSNIEWIMEQFFKREKKEFGDKVYDEMDKIIETIPPGSEHLICTPWMLGERCPVSSTTTRATLFNINPEHTREHLMRAVYEGIGYNLRWILENFKKDYGFQCSNFRIIGGGALDDAWMQIIADITGVEFSIIDNPRNAGALGSAIIALIGLGKLKDFSSAKDFVTVTKTFKPNNLNFEIYNKLFKDYKNVYYGLKKAYDKANRKRFEGDI